MVSLKLPLKLPLELPLELPLCAAGPPSVAQSMPTALRSYATHRSAAAGQSLVLLQGQSEHECVASLGARNGCGICYRKLPSVTGGHDHRCECAQRSAMPAGVVGRRAAAQ
jgi:hypothetical protein